MIPVGSQSRRWSAAVAQRYDLVLSESWCDWFDGFPIAGELTGEFCEPVMAERLLDATPDVIWPGLMPPDFLPLAGNGLGDWLGARVAADNTIGEVVYWYHGGGDCLPYGNTMAEAIWYDALSHRFPGRQQWLAIAAEPRQPLSAETILACDAVRWAYDHLPPAAAEVLRHDFPTDQTAAHLLQWQIAEVPVRCDEVLAALDNEIRQRMTPQLASRLHASWDAQAVRWMFDPALMPADQVRVLEQIWKLPARQWKQQDWGLAAEHCQHVAAQRQDLAWVHDVLGWSCQRQGDLTGAIDHYRRGAMASVFTDQSVRFRTHFDSDRVCKFSIARLIDLDAIDTLDSDYVQRLIVDTSPADIGMTGWRDQACEYWLGQAAQISGSSAADAAQRYDLLYRAGWDVGCDSITRYCNLLDALHDAALQAGQMARALLAKTHRDCFRSRYAIG